MFWNVRHTTCKQVMFFLPYNKPNWDHKSNKTQTLSHDYSPQAGFFFCMPAKVKIAGYEITLKSSVLFILHLMRSHWERRTAIPKQTPTLSCVRRLCAWRTTTPQFSPTTAATFLLLLLPFFLFPSFCSRTRETEKHGANTNATNNVSPRRRLLHLTVWIINSTKGKRTAPF